MGLGVYKMDDMIVSQEFQKVSVKGRKLVTEKKYQWEENPSRRDKAQAAP